MLNRYLYSALKASFGSVLIENENESADIESDPADPSGYGWKFSENGNHGEQYLVRCPVCGDRSHHLYVSYLSFARPVMSGTEMRRGRLIAHCFRNTCMSRPEGRELVESMIGMGMAAVDGKVPDLAVDASGEIVQDSDPTLPRSVSDEPTAEGMRTWSPSYTPCLSGMPDEVADYLRERRVGPREQAMFGIGWGPVVTPLKGIALAGGHPWIQVPVIMNGRLKGMQARCLPQYLTGDGMKYWLHPGMRKKTVVYNLDRARDLGTAVLCEGVFDVFSIGAPGVCCFGHTPSAQQLRLLASVGKALVWLPDTDWHADIDTVAEARSLAADLNAAQAFELGAHVVTLPGKDAGDMERTEVWTSILEQVPEAVRKHLLDNVVGRL